MGAVLQQRVNTWQPLAFFSKKLSSAQLSKNTELMIENS
jgi:hypothetical protein